MIARTVEYDSCQPGLKISSGLIRRMKIAESDSALRGCGFLPNICPVRIKTAITAARRVGALVGRMDT